MHEVLVNRLGGLSLPRKSVVRLTDRPDMTLDVYRGRKTTMQQQQQLPGPTVLISTMLSHPGPDKNHVYLMHWLYRKSVSMSSSDVCYFSRYVKYDVTL